MFGKINETVDLVKNGLDITIDLATVEQKGKLLDAKKALIDLKSAYLELSEENIRLKEKIKNNKKMKYDKSGVIILDGGLWCSACYGAQDKLIHLAPYGDYHYQCPNCEYTYKKQEAHLV